jgi:hypothetical protein
MGKPVIGEAVVLPFPQTNLQSGKRRPALVAASLPGDDLIRCQITSRNRSDGDATLLDDFERAFFGPIGLRFQAQFVPFTPRQVNNND